MTINRRIEKLIEHVGNKSSFSRAIGVRPSVIQNITGQKQSKPGFILIQKILTKFEDLNAEWLILGKGTIWKPEKSTTGKTQDQQAALINKTVKQEVKKQTEILEKLIESQKREINTLTSYIARLEKELQKYENPNSNSASNS